MQLFLAKKHGNANWLLHYSQDVDDLLIGDSQAVAKCTVEAMRMRRVCALKTFFSRDLATKTNAKGSNIHFVFVVQLPPELHPLAPSPPMPSYDVADLTESHIVQFLNKLHLAWFRERAEVCEPYQDTSIPGFAWESNVNDSDQRERYITYLRDIILMDLGTSLFLEDASEDDTLMISKDDRLPFALCGRADLVLVDNAAKQQNEFLAGLHMVIMVCEDVRPQDKAQIIGQLISVGLKTTKMCHRWRY